MLPRMTAEQDLPHKLGQMHRDLDDLYELISQGQARITGTLMRHHNRLEELQQTLDLHNGRLDRIEDNQRRQFDQLSAQMAEILGVLRGSAPVADSTPGSAR
jgi:septal ring factor EnvC (AmiA/AmiB activator)